MNAKDKAEDLVNKHRMILMQSDTDLGEEIQCSLIAKQCALITVDEIINTLNYDIRDIDVRGNILLDLIDCWKQIKQELEKL
jgi:hypothetical protein